MNLDKEQLDSLESFLGSCNICSCLRMVGMRNRRLYGPNSVMLRTVGEDFSPELYQRNYFDEFRKAVATTEFAEFMEALAKYDSDPSREKELDLVLEVGDLIFQRTVVEKRHRKDPKYREAVEELTLAIGYAKEELAKRRIDLAKVNKLARIKYGIRCWMVSRGLPSKDKDFEREMCMGMLE